MKIVQNNYLISNVQKIFQADNAGHDQNKVKIPMVYHKSKVLKLKI